MNSYTPLLSYSFYIALVFIFIIPFGCTKNETDEPPSPSYSGCRILSHDNGTFTYVNTINDIGRVIKTTEADGDYTVYTYGVDTLGITEYSATGEIKYKGVAEINSFGYITKWVNKNNVIVTAEYNSEGYITKLVETDSNGVLLDSYSYTVVNGNILEIENISRFSNNQYRTYQHFREYFFDKENKGGIGIDDWGIWRFFYKPSKHLVSKLRYHWGDVYDYSYTFTNDGLPSKVVVKKDGIKKEEISYSFLCK